MNIQQAARIAPTAILLAFLAYSGYSLVSALPDAAERRAEISDGVDALLKDLASAGEEVARLEGSLRDPFRIVIPPPPEPEATAAEQEAEAGPDPLEAIVADLNLEATFVQGKNQIAIIDGRIYNKGQPLVINDAQTPDAKLVLLFVKPTGVILRGVGKNYTLGYPEHFARKPTSEPRPPDASALDLGSQAEMFRKLLNSPLGAMGKGLLGNVVPSGAAPRAARSRKARGRGPRPPAGTGQ